ncbi:MAG: DUF11 domain-containing protein [Candidatus Peribacteria bacterium]|jgi:hypothetical protein|nr:DUF11 domain-containing protein [Candidatus Peribacteria bacterium]
MTTGSRIIELVADNSLKSRNKLYINASINKGGEIKYTVYDNAGLSGISLLTETNPTGYLDLSSLTFTGTLYVEIAVISPEVEIRDYKATYFSTITPKIELEAQVKDDSILSDEIINTAYISTTTPESNTTNNTHMYTLYTEATDLSITKSVDNASVAINDELTYTITYENK